MSSDAPSATTPLPPFLAEEAFVDAPEDVDEHAPVGRDALQERARAVLTDRMGPGGAPSATAYACGTVGVQADQIHYSDGFGLFLPLRQGVAVAARPAETARVTFAGADDVWTDESASPPPWVLAARRVLRELLAEGPVELAVVSTVPGACQDGYLAALAVALTRVVRALDLAGPVDLDSVERLRDDLVPLLTAEIGDALGQPYGLGYVLAAFAGAGPAFTLVDTATREHLPVETEAREALRWAVLDPRASARRDAAFHRRRRTQAEEALRVLRANGFGDLAAFRDLEHRALETALPVLPSALRPVVRHLVAENRRVQKHVAAMRQGDWQMIGALLLMSHASQRDHWEGTPAAADALVAEAESRTHDGLYGACMTGRAGAVLVAGRPPTFGQELRRLVDAAGARRGAAPRVLVP
jgi:galactokinase